MKKTYSLNDKKTRIMLYLVIALFAVIVSLVATGAWFLDRDEVNDELPFADPVVVELTGTGEDGSLKNFAELYSSAAGAYPGDKILDSVSVKMGEKTGESVLRVQYGVNILNESHEVKSEGLTDAETALLSMLTSDLEEKTTVYSSDWSQNGEWIYYKHLASGGAKAIQLFDEYSLPLPDSQMDNDYQELSFRISLSVEAIQAANILSDDEWNTAITSLEDSMLLEAVLKYNGERFSAVAEVLPYIETTGTQYIDTGFVPNQDTGIKILFSSSSFSNGFYLFGGGGSAYNDRAFECYPWDNRLQLNYGNKQANLSITLTANNKYFLDWNKTNYAMKNQTTQQNVSGTLASNTFTSEKTLCLLALNRITTTSPSSSGRIYSCQIYDNGTLVRNLVPARDTEGNVGMFDLVSAEMFYNAGSGEFSYGHSIVYMTNGGTLDSSSPKTFVAGDLPITLKSPTREGYEFDGWFLSSDFSGNVQTTIPAQTDNNVYLYAKWIKTYNITYHLGGGTNDAGNPNTYNGNELPITLNNPVRDGYTFGGWFANADFSGEAITQIATGATNNISLWAKWIADEKTITYVLDGGTNDDQNISTWTMLDAPVRIFNPTKDGMTFEGWFSSSDFSGERVTYLSKDMFGDITLYAKWATTHTITYNLNGGLNDGRNPASFTKNSDTITLYAPTRVNYSFVGWFENEDFSGSATTQIASGTDRNIVLWAKWNSTQITVTFDALGGGVSPIKQVVEKGGTYGDLPTPTKAGYTFDGWQLLKEDYTQLEYIQATGTQYINTGYYWKSDNVRVILSANVTEQKAGQSLFGNEEYLGSDRYFALIPHNSSGTPTLFTLDRKLITYSYMQGVDMIYDVESVASGQNKTITLNITQNGTTTTFGGQTYNTAGSLVTNPNNLDTGVGIIYLFASHNSGRGAVDGSATPNLNAQQYVGGMKLYSFKMYDNGILVRDYVPVKRNSDGVIGLYDIVESKFYVNSGTGTFVAGDAERITSTTLVSTNVDHTLYARWIENVYEITYNLDGGTNNAGNPSTFSRTQLSVVLLDATKDGAYFAGWYLDSAFTKRITQIDGGTLKDVEVWARFSNDALVFDLVGSSAYSVRAANISISGDIVIPATYDGKPVVVIQNNAFKDCTEISSVEIPTSVKSIGVNAFENCSSLESVVIPNGVTLIPNNAFKGCSALLSIDIPTSVEGIGSNAFAGCTSLTSVTLPQNVSDIGTNAFANCSALTTVEVYADEPATIKSGAFPSSVQAIYVKKASLAAYKSAWSEYSSKIVAFPTYSITYNLDGGTNNEKNVSEFAKFDLPLTLFNPTKENADFLGWYLSSDFSGEPVTEISIVQNITLYARWDRKMTITYVLNGGTNNAANLTTISESMLPYTLNTPSKKNYMFLGWFVDEAFTNEITTISSLANITIYASWEWDDPDLQFELNSDGTGYIVSAKNKAIVDANIPNSYRGLPVLEISSSGFKECTNLTSIEIPSGLTVIGDYAFDSCPKLKTVVFVGGNQQLNVGSYAFRDCEELISITFGSGIETINNGAFDGCEKLTRVNITNLSDWFSIKFTYSSSNPLYYAHQLYLNGVKIKELTIPSEVTSISNYAFYKAESLTKLVIPSTLTSIGVDAFYSCKGLTAIVFADKNQQLSIESSAFSNCDGLTRVDISDLSGWFSINFANSLSNPLDYAHHLYLNGTEITELTIPEGVTEIQSYALCGASALTQVYIPSSVTTISASSSSYSPFYGCSSSMVICCEVSSKPSDWGTYWNYYDGSQQLTVLWGMSGFLQENEEWRYAEKSDGNIEVVRYIGKSKNVEIPTNINGSVVNEIFSKCFYNTEVEISSITIPDCVTTIGEMAFANCSKISEIIIPSSVTKIMASTSQNSPFVGWMDESMIYCKSQSKPSGWESYWNYNSNTYLVAVYNFDKLETSGGWKFALLQNEEAIIVKYLGVDSFVVIPTTLNGKIISGLSGNVFGGCDLLSDLYLSSQISKIEANSYRTSPLKNSNKQCYIYTDATSKLSGWNTYWNYFDSGTALTVFWGVSQDAIKQNSEWQYVEKSDGQIGLMKYVGSKYQVTTPDVIDGKNVNQIFKLAFENSGNIQKITITENITILDNACLRGCTPNEITLYSLPSYLSVLFGGSSSSDNSGYIPVSLQKLTIQAGSVVDYALKSCESLKTIIIENGVTQIGRGALNDCSSLTDLTLPFVGASVSATSYKGVFGYIFDYQEIGETTSRYSSKNESFVTNITGTGNSGTTCSWSDRAYAFRVKTGGTIFRPTYTTYYGYRSFYYYIPSSIKTVTITGGVIHAAAFCRVKGFDVILGENVTEIENYAFYESGINEVFISESVTTINASSDSGAPFYGCNSSLEIYCGASSKPSGWGTYWNYYNSSNQLNVTWGASGLPDD